MALSTGPTSVGEDAITLKNIAAAGLVGQRLREIMRLGLHLVEQADVPDGDHGLVGKGLQSWTSCSAEWAGLGA